MKSKIGTAVCRKVCERSVKREEGVSKQSQSVILSVILSESEETTFGGPKGKANLLAKSGCFQILHDVQNDNLICTAEF